MIDHKTAERFVNEEFAVSFETGKEVIDFMH